MRPVLSKPAAFSAPRIRYCNCGGIAAAELSPSTKATQIEVFHLVGSTQPLRNLDIAGGCEVPTGGEDGRDGTNLHSANLAWI